MTFLLFLLFFAAPGLLEDLEDPLDNSSGTDRRPFDCEPITMAGARQRAPGQLGEASARGDYFERRAVICRERLMSTGVRRSEQQAGKGLRQAKDDAVLMQLRATSSAVARLVSELPAEQQKRTWLVEAYYPQVAVGQKIGFAVKNALLDHGLRVTDRAPTLAAGDIEVIGHLDKSEAYPLACLRYRASGSLGPTDALVAVVSLDSRETTLHTGVCVDGQWSWLK